MSPIDSEELIRQAAEVLRAHGATEVYVFGTFAHGDVRPDSDLDIAVRGLVRLRRRLLLLRAAPGHQYDLRHEQRNGCAFHHRRF